MFLRLPISMSDRGCVEIEDGKLKAQRMTLAGSHSHPFSPNNMLNLWNWEVFESFTFKWLLLLLSAPFGPNCLFLSEALICQLTLGGGVEGKLVLDSKLSPSDALMQRCSTVGCGSFISNVRWSILYTTQKSINPSTQSIGPRWKAWIRDSEVAISQSLQYVCHNCSIRYCRLEVLVKIAPTGADLPLLRCELTQKHIISSWSWFTIPYHLWCCLYQELTDSEVWYHVNHAIQQPDSLYHTSASYGTIGTA